MLGVLWLVQRRVSRGAARRRSADAVTVVSRTALGSKASLVIVQTPDARYVLGVTEHGVSVLDRGEPVDADPDADAPLARAGSFESILSSSRASGEDFAHAPQLRVRHRSDPLRGSILSPQTWRQSAEALRRAR